MDFEHFMDNFLALRSNHVPSLCPPVARLENVLDLAKDLISMVVVMVSLDIRSSCNFTVFLAREYYIISTSFFTVRIFWHCHTLLCTSCVYMYSVYTN